ncbi:hypothetical protein [Pyxidicoccus sp. MSG2]|uniref:hypothetical protein n=1 Tax=Pyxidicoccus sp. MSG2 TaxID=2996790 RepID=UPI0022704D19|nr:hypothetical protein [Pyxidicoccus sp. MSG2]MCY1015527.1 hypothetical protein [Pyxidicoccus sp. MSG2]
MRSRVLASLFPLSLMAAGCLPTQGKYQSLSSGLVGCAPDQIQIANDQVGVDGVSWEAVCNGHRFYCSGVGKIAACKEPPADTARKEVAPAPAEAAPSPAA